jgi:sortase A
MTIRTAIRAICALALAAGMANAAQAAWIPARAALAQSLLERAFATSMANHVPVRALVSRDSAPVARISVPRLGVGAVVLAGRSRSALSLAPTELSSRVEGVRVFAGHRDTHFAFIRELQIGDRIDVTDAGGVHRYQVTRFETVRHDRFAIAANPGHAMIALATCFPFDAPITAGPGTPWRRVAWAEAVDGR